MTIPQVVKLLVTENILIENSFVDKNISKSVVNILEWIRGCADSEWKSPLVYSYSEQF